jgi:urease accessory protein UreF
MPTRTPSNGLETANQNETFQPKSSAVGFVFTLFSQAFEDRHFTECEISFETLNEVRRIWIAASRLEDSTRQWTGHFLSAGAAFSEYVCSPSSTSSPRWLCTVARVVTMPVFPCVVSLVISSWGYSVSPACTSFRNRSSPIPEQLSLSSRYFLKRSKIYISKNLSRSHNT